MGEFCRCLDCRHAKWDRTSSGRLHPNSMGWCEWYKIIALPASMTTDSAARVNTALLQVRHIERKHPIAACKTYQPANTPNTPRRPVLADGEE